MDCLKIAILIIKQNLIVYLIVQVLQWDNGLNSDCNNDSSIKDGVHWVIVIQAHYLII